MEESPDDRPPMVLALEWTSRITTVSLEMVLPGLLGHWADQKLGTGMLLLVLGVLLGLGVGMWHLIKMTQTPGTGDGPQQDADNDPAKR